MIKVDDLLEAKKANNNDRYEQLWNDYLNEMEKRIVQFLAEGMTIQSIIANNQASLFTMLQDPNKVAVAEIAKDLLDEITKRHHVSVVTSPEEIKLGDIIHWKWKAIKGKDKGKWFYSSVQIMKNLGNNNFIVRYPDKPLNETFELTLTTKNIISGCHSKLPREPHSIFFFFNS